MSQQFPKQITRQIISGCWFCFKNPVNCQAGVSAGGPWGGNGEVTSRYREMRISKKRGRGRKEEGPLPLVGQGPPLGSRLLYQPCRV